MPVGKFRSDPRELDEVERRVSSLQYPEAGVPIGMGLGLVLPLLVGTLSVASLPLAVLAHPAGPVVGPVLGGVIGYLLGHRLKERRIRTLKEKGDLET